MYILSICVMNASRDFARQQRLALLGFKAVFVGNFRQHIVAQTTISGRLHIRTLGVIFTHLWVYPNQPLRQPYLFQWIAPFHGTKVQPPIPYMGVIPSWTTEFLPFIPYSPEPPVSPAGSSSSSETEDTSHQPDQADEPPPCVNEEPGTDYIENSGVEESDLEYGMDIVTLADGRPPINQ